MKKMNVQGNTYTINSRKSFVPHPPFRYETIECCLQFAYAMTFGNQGEHRNHRTGGTHERRKGEIFANAFQGKLAECALYNYFHFNGISISKPDFDVYELGRWDEADFYIDGEKISVKSTKSFGNLLLLETRDWNENGVYLPNGEAYQYTFLVRMAPYCEDIFRRNRLLYSDQASIEEIKDIILDQEWTYDIPGFVTLDELKHAIRNDFIIPQGAMLNGKTRMDAENYYIQSGDMHDIEEFGAMYNEKS